MLKGLDVGQILSGGLNNPTLLALVSNILSSLFSGGIDVNRITGGAVGLDLVLQEAIRNVLGVLDQRQLSSSFLGGSSSSGGSTNGLQQIFTIFDGRLDALGLANVEATLRALLSLNGVGNRLFNAGRTEDGEILSKLQVCWISQTVIQGSASQILKNWQNWVEESERLQDATGYSVYSRRVVWLTLLQYSTDWPSYLIWRIFLTFALL